MSEKKDQKDIKKAAGNKVAAKKPKKPRRSLVRVFKDTVQEGKKVTWPSRKDWLNHTAVVTIFVVLMMAVVFAIDSGLTFLLQLAV